MICRVDSHSTGFQFKYSYLTTPVQQPEGVNHALNRKKNSGGRKGSQMNESNHKLVNHKDYHHVLRAYLALGPHPPLYPEKMP